MPKSIYELSKKEQERLKLYGIDVNFIQVGLATPPSIITLQENTRLTQDRIKSNNLVKAHLPKLNEVDRDMQLYTFYYNHGSRLMLDRNIIMALRGLADREAYDAKEKLNYETKLKRIEPPRKILERYLPHHAVAEIALNQIQPALEKASTSELKTLRKDIIEGRVPMSDETERVLAILENAIISKTITKPEENVKKKQFTDGYVI